MSYYEDGGIKIILEKNDISINELIENEGIAKYALKLNENQITRLKAVFGVDLKENNEGKINNDEEVFTNEQSKSVAEKVLNKYKDTINNIAKEDISKSASNAIELTEKDKVNN